MPKLNDATIQQHNTVQSHYGFSATKIDNLGASEYTLASVVVDVSSSVASFAAELTRAVKEVVRACKYSPRADNLMIRVTQFATQLDEVHGFKLLENCNESDYDCALTVGGSTSLYDASANAIEATSTYALDLKKNDYEANGIVVVITDGDDNASTLSVSAVKKALVKMGRDESLESLVTILVGVNIQDKHIGKKLKSFKDDVGFTQYVELDNADARTLAKLADFVSKSISAQSQSLGTGGPSQSLTI
ncbi:MAG: VWA domain-containing protein [Akkermansiaceae bacterium]|nr:VWA domain-containing protein [Armatimonadota bacterium]